MQHKNDSLIYIYNKSLDVCLSKNRFYGATQSIADYFILLGQ